jgi:aryl-alcohol dehydrogenase-like predicted oxidoreductase
MALLAGASRFGLGTAPLGSTEDGPLWWGPQSRSVAIDTVLAAIERGAAFIDTAPFYGWGRAEEIIGQALARTSRRVPIFTKCGTVRCDDGSFVEDGRPAAIRADVERSLERLGVDRIDVVQLHDPDTSTPIEVTWEALLELQSEGLIGAAGLSNHATEALDRAEAIAPVSVVQHQYSLLHRAPERDGILIWCADHDRPLLACSPLASGFLTDDFDLERLDPSDLRRRLRWATSDQDLTTAAVEALAEIGADHGTTLTTTALAWLCRHDHVYPIVGARTPAEAERLGEAPLRLNDAEFSRLDDLLHHG